MNLSIMEQLVAELVQSELPVYLWLDEQFRENRSIVLNAIRDRTTTVSPEEEADNVGLLDTGLFAGLSDSQRIAGFALSSDLAAVVAERKIAARFKSYSSAQPLFVAEAQLLRHAREAELIDLSVIADIEEDGAVRLSHGYGRLEPLLPVPVLEGVKAAFPKAFTHVRLDPEFFSVTRPLTRLQEAVVRPANPRWWLMLGSHRVARTGGVYHLQPIEPPTNDPVSAMEYYGSGIRRIETSSIRRSADYASLMFEELQYVDDLLIGRMVHADTHAAPGTMPQSGIAEHVDLAVNVYTGDDAQRRFATDLSKGKVAKASFRTHVLRIESAPIAAVVPLTHSFFLSQVLVSEMMADQFERVTDHSS